MESNPKNNIEDIYELTPMQQGMLFHTLYTHGSDAYFEQFCYSLSGDLDEELFKRSWMEVIKRHPVFRTSFQWKGISKPVQVVSKKVDPEWTTLDWTNFDKIQQESEYNKFIKSDRQKGFNMEKPSLTRFTLIKTGIEEYEFVWSFHHIIMDGWSYPVVQSEVFAIYESLKEQKKIELPAPSSYKDFILWLSKQSKIEAGDFWKDELKGFNSPTSLPDKSESRQKIVADDDEIKSNELIFTREFTESLQKFARQNQITLNTIIQGVWAIIISKYRNETDVVFGGVVSGRSSLLKGIESMVGLFINTLPVRIKLDGKENIIRWLKKIQEKNSERDQYNYSSLVDIQELSEIKRGTQLFDSIVVFENYPIDKSLENGRAGIKIKNLRAFERTSFPLTVLAAPGESLSLKIAYETSKFDEHTIKQVLGNFKTLLENILQYPERKLEDIEILTADEKNKIVTEWNNTRHVFPEGKSIRDLFEEQVLKTPDRTALESGKVSLAFRNLDQKANQIANYLKRLGAKPNRKIGICIERSADMAAGLLGIVKSGSAYVPLDSSLPLERLNYMLEDSGADILLTKEDLAGKFSDSKVKIVLIDRAADEIEKESSVNECENAKPEDLAYVIYTSGSTGKPKGVLMKQGALTNLINWQIHGQKFDRTLRTLQFTTLGFDVSFQEIFSTWCSGGTLVLLTDQERQDLRKVMEILHSKKIERLFLPYIALQQLAELYSGNKKQLQLKEVMTAGEQLQCTPEIVNFFKDLNDVTFTNHYGPSEAHVVTSYTLEKNPDEWITLTPIGKPIYNNQIYILDPMLNPVPVGVTGDLYIGGVGLVAGYQNNPGLTNEKFIDNPFDKTLSQKIYKTGDIARYLPDGNIEFLGRSDNQIKIRGFRVEPGEIESVICEYKGIRNAVIVDKDFEHSDKRIIAYIVNEKPANTNADDLRKFLKGKLPDYMLPSDFVFIEKIPLTATGKVNLKELPEPQITRLNKTEKYSEPKDALELQLVKIWEKVLGVKPIGVKDNFFDLGGHSLLALRVFGYIEKITKRKLAISTLFNSPTIEELAEILRDEGWTPPWKSLVAVKPGGSKLPFFCVPPGAGTALHFQGLVKYIPDDQPFYVLESVGLDGKEKPHAVLEEMASFYVKEIQSLQPEGPYLLGGRCFGGRVVFEMAQQFAKLGQKVALLAIFDTWPPFTAPPPYREPFERDLKHFVTQTFVHLKTGEFFKVAWKYFSNEFMKMKWKVKNKMDTIFSTEKDKLYREIMLIHFRAQDRYIAKSYPGKITLIECATFKPEYREKWKKLAEGGFEAYVVPKTNHKTIVREPKLRYFAEKLNYVLEKAHKEISESITGNGVTSSQKKKIAEEVNQ